MDARTLNFASLSLQPREWCTHPAPFFHSFALRLRNSQITIQDHDEFVSTPPTDENQSNERFERNSWENCCRRLSPAGCPKLSLTCLKRSRSRMTTQNSCLRAMRHSMRSSMYGDWRCRSANLAKQAAQRLLVWSRRWRLRFAVVRPSFYCLTPSDRRKFSVRRLFHQGRANFCQVVKVGDGVQPSGEFAEMVSVTMIAVAHRLSGARQHEKKFFDLVGFSFEIFGRAFSHCRSRSSTWPSVSLISGR